MSKNDNSNSKGFLQEDDSADDPYIRVYQHDKDISILQCEIDLLNVEISELQKQRLSKAHHIREEYDKKDDVDIETLSLENRLEYLREEIDEAHLRIDFFMSDILEIKRWFESSIVSLTCDTKAKDKNKTVSVNYIGFAWEYLLEFTNGNKVQNPKLCIYSRRDDNTKIEIISGPIRGLPDNLVPGARVLLRTVKTSDEPEFKFVFEQQIFPSPQEDEVKELNNKIAQIEAKLSALSDCTQSNPGK